MMKYSLQLYLAKQKNVDGTLYNWYVLIGNTPKRVAGVIYLASVDDETGDLKPLSFEVRYSSNCSTSFIISGESPNEYKLYTTHDYSHEQIEEAERLFTVAHEFIMRRYYTEQNSYVEEVIDEVDESIYGY